MPGFVFSVDSVEIQNQKADNHHSDNDYLSLVWTVANTATKNVQTFKKTLRVVVFCTRETSLTVHL